MKIYLIRHGESTGDVEDRFGGEYDDPLTKKGKQQAKELANTLKGLGIQIIYTSPKLRARETSDIVATVLNVPIEEIKDLKERNNYGVLTGITKSEAKEKYPLEFQKISKDKTFHMVTGSESYDEIKQRVLNVFKKILQSNYNTIAVISHGGVISTYVRECLCKGKNIKLEDCAILEVTKQKNKFSFSCLKGAQLYD